jgi:MYND finger
MGSRKQRKRSKDKKYRRRLEPPPPLTAYPPLATNETTTRTSTRSANDEATVTVTATQPTFADVVRSTNTNNGNNDNNKNVAFLSPPPPVKESYSSEGVADDASADEPCLMIDNENHPTPPKRTVVRPFSPDVRCDDLLMALLAHLVPPRLDGPLSEEEHSLAMDLHAALQRGMTRRSHHQRDDTMQKVVEDTCWDFQDRCDQVYYQGEHGAFLHYCRLVGLTKTEWQDLVQETILEALGRFVVEEEEEEEEEEYGKEEPAPITTNPLQQVARELQEALTTCWECHGTQSCHDFGNTMMVCSQCKIPRYCSKKCQATAWASGHSKRCRADLKYTHALMKETLAVISHAAAARSIHGIHTYPVRDFMFATVVMDPQIQWIKHQFFMTLEDIEGPSMKFYYQNLAAIRRGEWWVFTDPCTEDDFQEILESKASALVVAQQRGELPQVHWLVWIQILLSFNLRCVIDKAQKIREEEAALAAASSDTIVDDPLNMSALTLRMESSFRMESHSPRLLASDGMMMQNDLGGRTITEYHELDSAVIEALLHPASWIHCYRNFYGVSMPSEALLKACTSDKPHELSMVKVKECRDFATWFVYKDLQNVYHK